MMISLHKTLIHILNPVKIIAISQLFGTSLWFSANSVTNSLVNIWNINSSDIGLLTGAVQIGFIGGTLTISLTGLADRYRPSCIFIFCSITGAIFNAAFAWLATGLPSALFFRFLVGLSLAGIYPIGMKLIVGWAPDKTGAALSLLVGMLTLGTALPHAIKFIGAELPWRYLITISSILAIIGAILIVILGDAPDGQNHKHIEKENLNPYKQILQAFKLQRFRSAAFGYFGHMWELYAFWTILPLLISATALDQHFINLGNAGLSFIIISSGFIGCLVGGYLSNYLGNAKVAIFSLTISGCCCFVFMVFSDLLNYWQLFILMIVWGASVVSDSPQFSAISAKSCPKNLIGSALSIQNAIGFGISIVSIISLTEAFKYLNISSIWVLIPGPIFGSLYFIKYFKLYKS